MPIISDSLEAAKVPASNFQYSRAKISSLGATDYSVCTICLDCSPSVEDFAAQLEQAVKTILKSCAKSARADNLMLRLVVFAGKAVEFHGFQLLSDLSKAKYDNLYQEALKLGVGGSTALYDTTVESIEAMVDYGTTLISQDFGCNGLLVVVTDGLDNNSTFTPGAVKKRLDDAKQQEKLESLLSILVGINLPDKDASAALDKFAKNAGFTQFIDVGNATVGSVAKLANFISKSISSQSQSLGSGKASAPLTI